jgi:hypothetical protein
VELGQCFGRHLLSLSDVSVGDEMEEMPAV